MTYATLEDVRAYTPLAGEEVSDEDLQRELEQAERDIDRLLLLRDTRDTDTGLKIDPVAELAANTLEQWQVDALNRATCAQTEYRLAMGADFFIRAQHRRVSGPDFSTEGELPYIGPKAAGELDGAGLTRGRAVSVTLTNFDYPPTSDGSVVS